MGNIISAYNILFEKYEAETILETQEYNINTLRTGDADLRF